jgi:hypothetical protein
MSPVIQYSTDAATTDMLSTSTAMSVRVACDWIVSAYRSFRYTNFFRKVFLFSFANYFNEIQ